MEQIWRTVVKSVAAFGGAVAGALGGWDATLRVLIMLMAVDYISGVVVAMMGRSTKTDYGGISSKAGFAGLLKKGLMLMVVLVAALLDTVIGSAMVRDAACWFYIANEGISILENMSLAGVPFPAKLKELLGQKLDEHNNTNDTGGDANA